MFYYKDPDQKSRVKNVDATNKQEAKKILQAIGIKKPVVYNEEEKNKYIEKYRVKTPIELWNELDPLARAVAKKLGVKGGLVTKLMIEDMGLDKCTNLPYYVVRGYNEGGPWFSGGFYKSPTEVESVIATNILSDDLITKVVDTKTMEFVSFNISVKVSLEIKDRKEEK